MPGIQRPLASIEKHEEVRADDPMARAYDETNRGISRNWNTKPIVVVSNSNQVPHDGPCASHTPLTLKKTRRWQGSDNVLLVYATASG